MIKMHVFETQELLDAEQAGILFDQIFDPPKKLERVNGFGEESKVVALLPGSPKQIQRLSLPRKQQNLAGWAFFLDLNG
jgi:hypothetical protein